MRQRFGTRQEFPDFEKNSLLGGLRQLKKFSLGMASKGVINHKPKRRSSVFDDVRPDALERFSDETKAGERASMFSKSSSIARASKKRPTERDFLSTSRTTPLRCLEGWATKEDSGTTSSRNNIEEMVTLRL